VRIEGMKFIPEHLEVAPGDTVVWTNKDFCPIASPQAKRASNPGTWLRTRAGD